MADECVNWRIERGPVYPVARGIAAMHRATIGRARIGDRRCRATRLDESNAPKLVVCPLLACCSIRGAMRPLPKCDFEHSLVYVSSTIAAVFPPKRFALSQSSA